MRTDTQPLLVQVQAVTAAATPLGEVPVEVVRLEPDRSDVVAKAVTRGDGIAVLELAPDLWGQRLLARLAGEAEQGVVLSRAELDGEVAAILTVTAAGGVDASRMVLLADHLVATRRVRADDLASDLAAPSPDSFVRLLPAAERARLLEDFARGLRRKGTGDEVADLYLVDPDALRKGRVKLLPIRELPEKSQPPAEPGDRPRPVPQAGPGLGDLSVGAARRPVLPRLPALGLCPVRPTTEVGGRRGSRYLRAHRRAPDAATVLPGLPNREPH